MIGRTNASVAGGGAPVTGHRVRFVFPDGTILGDQTVANGGNAVIPNSGTYPTIPNGTFLEFNQPTTNITSPREIGALYVPTISTNTYITIVLTTKSGLSGVQAVFTMNNPTAAQWTINWGDGEVYTSTANGAQTITKTNAYTTVGTYTIMLGLTNVTAITCSAAICGTFTKYIKNIIFGTKLYTANSVFYANLTALETISVHPNSTGGLTINTSNGELRKLRGLILTQYCTITNINGYRNLRVLSFADTIASAIGNISNLTNLTRIILPKTLASNGLSTAYTTVGNTGVVDYWYPTSVTVLPPSFMRMPKVNTLNLTQFTTLDTGASALQDSQIYSVNVSNLTTVPASFLRSNVVITSATLPTTHTVGTTLNEYAFYLNYSLVTVNIPTNTTIIGQYCFYACSSLPILDIPASVTTINAFALYALDRLNTLIVRNTTPPTLAANALLLNDSVKIYVPDASVVAYQAASGWSTYSAQIFPLSSL